MYSPTIRVLASLLIAGGLLAACSDNRRFDELVTNGSQFATPVDAVLGFYPKDFMPIGRGNPGGVPASCVAAKLVETGKIRFQPDPERFPWWRLTTDIGEVGSDFVRVKVGTRRLGAASNRRRWSESGTQFYSATYSYTVDVPRLFNGQSKSSYGPFEVRLTFMNSPAEGQWRLMESQLPLDLEAERQAIFSPLMADGGCELQAQITARDRAQAQAYDEIEVRLKRDHGVYRGPQPGTVVSANGKLIWQITPVDVAGQAWTAMDALCASRALPVGKHWRAPSLENLRTLMRNLNWESGTGDYSRVFLDTPDARLLGSATHNTDGTSITFQATDLFTYNGEKADWRTVASGMHTTHGYVKHANDYVSPDMDILGDPKLKRLGKYDRLLCVADL